MSKKMLRTVEELVERGLTDTAGPTPAAPRGAPSGRRRLAGGPSGTPRSEGGQAGAGAPWISSASPIG
jgi:hypothetical protein